MRQRIEVEYLGCKVQVFGEFEPGRKGNFDNPPEPAEFHLETALIQREDVTQWLEAIRDDFGRTGTEAVEELARKFLSEGRN